MIDTKERILDTAERLFAANGYSATSLRSIIAAAGVNLASVHYHFHNKEALLDAVIRRRVEPINRERLELLDRLEQQAGEGPPPSIGPVLMALVGPPMRMAREPEFADFVHLMGRILTESDPGVIRKHFGETFQRFMGAIARALPFVPPDELLLRAHLAMGAMAHALCGRAAIFGVTADVTADRVVSFLAAGMAAPVAAGSGGG